MDTKKASQVTSGQVRERLSFREATERAHEQIDVRYFGADAAFASEIVANIAEVYMLSDDAPVRIGGEQLDGYVLKEVLSQLTEEHVQLVIDNYRAVTYEIKHKKSYIRTALYNSVFELEASVTNRVSRDMAEE